MELSWFIMCFLYSYNPLVDKLMSKDNRVRCCVMWHDMSSQKEKIILILYVVHGNSSLSAYSVGSRFKGLWFDSHNWLSVEISGKLLIPSYYVHTAIASTWWKKKNCDWHKLKKSGAFSSEEMRLYKNEFQYQASCEVLDIRCYGLTPLSLFVSWMFLCFTVLLVFLEHYPYMYMSRCWVTVNPQFSPGVELISWSIITLVQIERGVKSRL